jgi:hypothetical protein
VRPLRDQYMCTAMMWTMTATTSTTNNG